MRIVLLFFLSVNVARADITYQTEVLKAMDFYSEALIEEFSGSTERFSSTMHMLMSKAVYESMDESTVVWKAERFIGIRNSYLKQNNDHRCVGSYDLPGKTQWTTSFPYYFSCDSKSIKNGWSLGQWIILDEQAHNFMKQLAELIQKNPALLFANTFSGFIGEGIREKLYSNYDLTFQANSSGASLVVTKKGSKEFETSFEFVKCKENQVFIPRTGLGEFEIQSNGPREFLLGQGYSCMVSDVRALKTYRRDLIRLANVK